MFKRKDYKEKQLRYSIRKVSFGAASVAIASLYLFMGSSAVSASEVQPVNGEQNTVTNTEEVKKNEKQTEETDIKKGETLDKTSLTKLIEEIDGKFTNGKYTSKTEDSVNQLKAALEAAKTALSTAQTQAELTQAHANLIVATTKLQTKSEDKKEAPVVDTTNGKATVGIKATNTEKASESNSIANSGSKDERNGKEMDKNNPLRTDAATTDTDPAAHQTYTAPAADANLAALTEKLKTLPNYIENNKKVQDMDTLGNEKGVAAGSVAEITEFGGWKAVNQDGSAGKFAIAKATDKGVFPVETMNILGSAATAYVGEQSFDRTSKYMLFLSEVRTQATKTKESYDGKAWLDNDGTYGEHTSKAVKGYNGIEKTFKVYSSDKQTKVDLNFKTGFSGHLDHKSGSTRANYKVEVFSIDSNNSETKVYEATFDPSVAKDNDDMKITPAKDSTSRGQSFNIPKNNKEAALEEFAKDVYKPYATGGTFTAKNINLPAGSQAYKVRISSAENGKLGLDYHSNYAAYALPVTGLDFNIDQDTGAIAKDLLSRIYDKLKATETADIDGKTNETKAAYLAELENIKTLVTSTDVKKTAEYKVALESILSKQLALKVDKTGLTESKTLLDGLVNEDPTPGKTQDTATAYNAKKQEAIKAIETAKKVIDNESATVAQVREALATVNEKKTALDAAKQALVEAATAEEKAKLKADAAQLTKADETGKTPDSIAAYEAEYKKLKTQLEEAKAAAAAVEAKGNNASKTEAQEAQAKVDAAKTALDKAAESLKNLDRDAAKKEIADAAKKATDTIEASTSLTPEQKAEEKAKIAKEAKDATDAIDNATTESGINSAKENGKLAIEKEAAISVINAEKAAKEQEIDNNTKLSDDEKAAAKAAVAKAATEAVEAIKNADTKDAVEAAKTKGEAAIKAVNPVGKEKALEAIQTAAEAKLAEIDKNDKLSAKEKAAAKAEVAKAAIEAVEAIQKATTQEAVNAAQVKGETAIKVVNPIGKEKALEAIQTAAEAKLAEIDKNTNLSAKEKAAAKAEVAKAAIEAVEVIQKAETQDAVDAAQVKGETAIKAVNPIGKEKALEAIQTTAEAKLAEIDKNTNLSEKEKAAVKAKVAKAAIEAVEAIQKAETQDAVDEAQAKGEATIKAVNPVGKEKALEAIKAIKEAKLAEIDKNTSLTADEKAAAKAAVEKAYNEAVEAIQKADTQEAVNDAQAKGEAAIKAVNLIGKEKALEAIKATKEAKLAEIEKDTSLSADEKAAAKAAIEKAYNEAVEAIKKAETQEEVNAAQLKGEAAIKAVNTIGKEDVNEAKEAVKAAAAEKIASIKANPNLSAEEKEKAIAEVERLKQAALDAIDKATTKAALDKALRTFLYQLDQESLVYERPTFNLEAYIQASITGVVKVELGKAITQAEVISRLNLPENVTIISVDLPDTNTLGRKFAKVILRLPDGTEATVFVPVEVVESSEEYNQQNHQPNNTPVKPQEDAKPAEVPSDNSEQPAVNQTEDVKGNSSTTSQESKASNQKVLPNTGTGNEISIFGSAAMTLLASLGLVATSKKKEEE